MRSILFKRSELCYDIANLAFVAADIREGSVEAHRLHQTFDVCEGANAEIVDRWLAAAFAEAGMLLRRITLPPPATGDLSDSDPAPTEYCLSFRDNAVSEQLLILIKERVHDFFISYVLWRWLEITLPEAAPVWEERTDDTKKALTAVAARSGLDGVTRRRISPL